MYDGVRKRVLPRIYEALKPGTDDDRMKGALYLLNQSSFGKPSILLARVTFLHFYFGDVGRFAVSGMFTEG